MKRFWSKVPFIVPLISMLILVFVVLLAFFYNSLASHIVDYAYEKVYSESDYNRNSLEKKVEAEYTNLRLIGSNVAPFVNNNEMIEVVLQNAVEKSDYDRIFFAYPDGQSISNDNIDINISNRSYFEELFTTGEIVSDVIESIYDQRVIIVFGVLIQSRFGEPLGGLFASYTASEFQKSLVDNYLIYDSTNSIVLNSNYEVVFNTGGAFSIFDNVDNLSIENSSIANVESDMSLGISKDYHMTLDGKEYYGYYQPIDKGNWYIFTYVSKKDSFFQLNFYFEKMIWVMIFLAISFIGAVFIIYYLSKRSKKVNSVFADSLSKLINNISGGVEICSVEKGYPIIYVSNEFCRITGYTKEELLKMKHIDLVFEEDKRIITDFVDSDVDSPMDLTYRIVRKNGDIIWAWDKGSIIKEDNNEQIYQCVIMDITGKIAQERKAIKDAEELRLINEKLNFAIDNSDLLFFEYYVADKRIVQVRNETETFGIPKEVSNVQRLFMDKGLLHPSSYERFNRLFERVENGEKEIKETLLLIDQSNKERHVELVLKNIFDDDCKPNRLIGVAKDITSSYLLMKERKLTEAINQITYMNFVVNITKNSFMYGNETWEKVSGLDYSSNYDSEIYRLAIEQIYKDDVDIYLDFYSRSKLLKLFTSGRSSITCEYRRLSIDKKDYVWIYSTCTMVKDDTTGELIALFQLQDISGQKNDEMRSKEVQKIYKALLSNAERIYEVDLTEDVVINSNEVFYNRFGLSQEKSYDKLVIDLAKHVTSDTIDDFLMSYDREKLIEAYKLKNKSVVMAEYKTIDSNNNENWWSSAIYLIEGNDERIKGFYYIKNIDKEKQKEQELIVQAQTDPLTKTYNRETAKDMIVDYVSKNGSNSLNAFIILDIDDFRIFNNRFGHSYGDEVLIEISSVIKSVFRSSDIIGRLGGDEFTIFVKNIGSIEYLEKKISELVTTINNINLQGAKDVKISISVGSYILNKIKPSFQEMYCKADDALYQAKEKGRCQYVIYDENNARTDSCSIYDFANITSKTGHNFDSEKYKNLDTETTSQIFDVFYGSNNLEKNIEESLKNINEKYLLDFSIVVSDIKDKKIINSVKYPNKSEFIDKIVNIMNIDKLLDSFDRNGILYCPNLGSHFQGCSDIFNGSEVVTALFIAIKDRGEIIGFVGYMSITPEKIWLQKEVETLTDLARIMSTFIREKR